MTFERPDVNPEQRYSVKETCYHLGICRDSLRKYTNSGHIEQHNHFTGAIFYYGKDILGFFDRLEARGEVVVRRGRKPKSVKP